MSPTLVSLLFHPDCSHPRSNHRGIQVNFTDVSELGIKVESGASDLTDGLGGLLLPQAPYSAVLRSF